MVDDRIAERRKEVRAARRRARLRRTLLVLALLVVTGVGIWFEQSEHARVTAIEIEGLDRLDAETVLSASGITVGDPAARIRLSHVARSVEELTLSRSVEVTRRGLRTIVIEVREREPVYSVRYRAQVVLVDRDGVIIDRGSDPRLPVVQLSNTLPEPGALVASQPALANAHRVWAGLSGPLRSRVVEFRAPDEDGLVLVLDTGLLVRFGRAEMLEEKIRAIGGLLDDIAGSAVTLIDVRVPSFPVVGIDAGAPAG